MEPIGWSYVCDGHGLKELEYGVMECLWHVFNKYSRDVVGAGCFVARKESEGFVKDCGGKFAYDHVLCRGGVAGIASCQGNAPLGSMLGSGESLAVSIFSTMAMTSRGLFVINPVSGSRSAVRFCVLDVCVGEVRADAVLRIYLNASLCFFTNIVRRADP